MELLGEHYMERTTHSTSRLTWQIEGNEQGTVQLGYGVR
jgi:hypothetical protein